MFSLSQNRNIARGRKTANPLHLETLEDRATPSVSMITSNFNGTAIPAGDYLWFSSVAKVQGVGSSPVTLDVTDATISFTADGAPYTLDVPDSTITLNPSLNGKTGVANTSYGASGWTVTAPTNFSGNVLLSGLEWQAVNGLPGGIQNVTWSADFTASVSGLNVNWQFACAVYTEFASSLSGVQVKTVDDNHADVYQNSDHAGTPENYKSFVTGGAMGGGGSNWTGSYSATASVQPSQQSSSSGNTGSISGNVSFVNPVTEMEMNLFGWTVTLTDNTTGQVYTTTTDGEGNYSFGSLAAGDYTLSVAFPDGTTGSLEVSLAAGQSSTSDNLTGY